MAGFQLGVTDESGALRDGVDVLILPDGIRLLTPEERRSRERAAGDRLGSAKAKLFASALPARAAKATGGQGTPAMPVLAPRPYVESSRGGGDVEHRCQLPLAMVARLISAKDVDKTPGGRAAIDAEWDALKGRGCWNIANAQKWNDVKKKANAEGRTIHLGSMLELLYQKGDELPEGDLNRKLKGRVVFLGDRVRDQHGAAAVFEELASSPAGMEASKFVDAYGLIGGHVCQQADAEQAYTQALLESKYETWMRVPAKDRKPEWGDAIYVVNLIKALYGHPQAGAFWEQRCERALKNAGFVPLGDCGEWRSVFLSPEGPHVAYGLR